MSCRTQDLSRAEEVKTVYNDLVEGYFRTNTDKITRSLRAEGV